MWLSNEGGARLLQWPEVHVWFLQDMQWTVHKGGTESRKGSVCWNGWEGRFGVPLEWPLLTHHKTITWLPSSHDPLTQVQTRTKPVGLKYPHSIATVPKTTEAERILHEPQEEIRPYSEHKYTLPRDKQAGLKQIDSCDSAPRCTALPNMGTFIAHI